MGELGFLLELLHDADPRARTLQAEFRGWSVLSPGPDVVVKRDGEGPERLRWRSGAPWPQTVQDRRRLWSDGPDRLRVELWQEAELVRLGVRAGPRWWRWDRDAGESAGSLDDHPWLPPLLDPPALSPARLIAFLRLEPAGVGERAGRRVLMAHGFPRAARSRGDVCFELEIDAEHGTLVRRARLLAGRCVDLSEAKEVRYELPIDRSRFELPSFQHVGLGDGGG
jgi:hypothetical protein